MKSICSSATRVIEYRNISGETEYNALYTGLDDREKLPKNRVRIDYNRKMETKQNDETPSILSFIINSLSIPSRLFSIVKTRERKSQCKVQMCIHFILVLESWQVYHNYRYWLLLLLLYMKLAHYEFQLQYIMNITIEIQPQQRNILFWCSFGWKDLFHRMEPFHLLFDAFCDLEFVFCVLCFVYDYVCAFERN